MTTTKKQNLIKKGAAVQKKEVISMLFYMDDISKNHIDELRKNFSNDVKKNLKTIKKAYNF